MNLDEFEQLIQDTIKQYEDILKRETEAINQFENDFNKISTIFDDLVKTINSCSQDGQYIIREAIEKAL